MKQFELVNVILGDVGNRTDLTSDASAAVSSAIRYYNRERFHFLEAQDSFSLSSSQVYYDIPADFSTHLDTMLIKLSGSKSPLRRTTWIELDEIDDGKTYGNPQLWAYFGNQIRMYPVPNTATTCYRSYHKKLDPPSITGSNVWTQIAADLIRFRASGELWKNKLMNAQEAANCKQSEMDEYISMMTETTKRISTGKLRKSGW